MKGPIRGRKLVEELQARIKERLKNRYWRWERYSRWEIEFGLSDEMASARQEKAKQNRESKLRRLTKKRLR